MNRINTNNLVSFTKKYNYNTQMGGTFLLNTTETDDITDLIKKYVDKIVPTYTLFLKIYLITYDDNNYNDLLYPNFDSYIENTFNINSVFDPMTVINKISDIILEIVDKSNTTEFLKKLEFADLKYSISSMIKTAYTLISENITDTTGHKYKALLDPKINEYTDKLKLIVDEFNSDFEQFFKKIQSSRGVKIPTLKPGSVSIINSEIKYIDSNGTEHSLDLNWATVDNMLGITGASLNFKNFNTTCATVSNGRSIIEADKCLDLLNTAIKTDTSSSFAMDDAALNDKLMGIIKLLKVIRFPKTDNGKKFVEDINSLPDDPRYNIFKTIDSKLKEFLTKCAVHINKNVPSAANTRIDPPPQSSSKYSNLRKPPSVVDYYSHENLYNTIRRRNNSLMLWGGASPAPKPAHIQSHLLDWNNDEVTKTYETLTTYYKESYTHIIDNLKKLNIELSLGTKQQLDTLFDKYAEGLKKYREAYHLLKRYYLVNLNNRDTNGIASGDTMKEHINRYYNKAKEYNDYEVRLVKSLAKVRDALNR